MLSIILERRHSKFGNVRCKRRIAVPRVYHADLPTDRSRQYDLSIPLTCFISTAMICVASSIADICLRIEARPKARFTFDYLLAIFI
ncbi:hypothetical protein [Neorhizobium sp. JUb45]|uniref:hypothetical protein n=1 Tax=Neorhizobium sp. JUb45 TaxID=2485113 RepID=UPI00104D09EF|nr:hypothetical protein [Neorhizobium sp. JUb45]